MSKDVNKGRYRVKYLINEYIIYGELEAYFDTLQEREEWLGRMNGRIDIVDSYIKVDEK